MRPLIDGDILRYEVGFSAQPKDEEGNTYFLDFDRVAELLDDKIELICKEVDATEKPIIYLTADSFLIKEQNKSFKLNDLPLIEQKPNFREAMAVTKAYKGTRKEEKPFHFKNISAYMLASYDCCVANGLEADDLMAITQYANISKHKETIICSRDKDLRMCPGWHYSWECGKQASIGPIFTDDLGWLEKKPDGKVIGYGKSFFYYQMLAGDSVDNIPGVPGIGPVKAFKLLTERFDKSELSLYQRVVNAYQEAFKEDWKTHIREMANLLWIVRELDQEGNPVLFKPLGMK